MSPVRRVLLAVALLSACGGDDATTASAPDAGADATLPDTGADGSADTGPTVDGGNDSGVQEAGSDAGGDARADANADAGTDSGRDAATFDAGFTTSVVCGTGSCPDAGDPPLGNFCCVPGLGMGGNPFCASQLGQCQTGSPFYCTSAANCTGGDLCCESTVRDLFSCQLPATCSSQLQLCKGSGECANGLPCLFFTCRGEPIGTCGPLPDGGTRLRCN
jgi:hypothetical protein